MVTAPQAGDGTLIVQASRRICKRGAPRAHGLQSVGSGSTPFPVAHTPPEEVPMPMLPEGTFASRVALITGGGTGLGLAMGQELARLGARIVVASRKAEHLDHARSAIPGEVLALPLDVRQPDQVQAVVQQAAGHFGGIDLLINNAAGNFVCPAAKLSVNGWNAVVGIVLHGTFYMTREVGKHMIARGRGGSILNIVATYAEDAGPGVCHSAAAKAGVLSLTRSLAVEWAEY